MMQALNMKRMGKGANRKEGQEIMKLKTNPTPE